MFIKYFNGVKLIVNIRLADYILGGKDEHFR